MSSAAVFGKGPSANSNIHAERTRMKITWIQLNLKANKMTCQAFIFFKSDAILRTWDSRCEEGIVSQCFEYESLRIHTKLFYRDWSGDRAVLREVYCVKTGFRSVCLALYLFIKLCVIANDDNKYPISVEECRYLHMQFVHFRKDTFIFVTTPTPAWSPKVAAKSLSRLFLTKQSRRP